MNDLITPPWADHAFAPWALDPALDSIEPTSWRRPLRWDREAARLDTRYRVLCAPPTDVFGATTRVAWQRSLWALIRETPHLDWIVTTTAITEAARQLPADWGHGYENVWLGVVAPSQAAVNTSVPALLDVPAYRRLLWAEPLGDRVDLSSLVVRNADGTAGCYNALTGVWRPGDSAADTTHGGPHLDWVITGGGPDERLHPEWARDLRDQCLEANVAFYFTRWGAVPYLDPTAGLAQRAAYNALATHQDYIYGRSTATDEYSGERTLDGRTWDEVPA